MKSVYESVNFFLILILTIEKRLKLNLRVHAQGDIGVRVGNAIRRWGLIVSFR